MNWIRTTALLMLLAVASAAQAETVTNVARGKPVTLLGGTFFVGGWDGATISDPATITDGLFFPQSSVWDVGTIWWDAGYGETYGSQAIQVDLGGAYVIESLIVQADDNDTYEVTYLSAETGTWVHAWTAGPIGPWGMQTRPNPLDDTERYVLDGPIKATALRVTGIWPSDFKYSVSEIQAFGYPLVVPVSIDVKPGSDPNSINLGSEGTIAVAVFGSASFDATSIDLSTVTFANAQVATKRSGAYLYAIEDVNGDGIADVVLHVYTQDLVLSDNATEAVLDGWTNAGRPFRGTDLVRVVP